MSLSDLLHTVPVSYPSKEKTERGPPSPIFNVIPTSHLGVNHPPKTAPGAVERRSNSLAF